MSYIPKYEINEKIRSNLQEIEKLKDKIRGRRILPEAEASIHLRASVETVHSSTSIEGNPLNSSEVRALITSDKILTKEEYAEIEVQNYKNALDYIDKRRHGDSEIRVEDILTLHHIITDRLLDETRNGHFRRNSVYIETPHHEIVYTAVAPEMVEDEITDLLNWVKENQFSINPVIIAAVLHLRIAAIHPFADGNGRTARALVSLYLALNQYDCDGALVLDSYYATDRPAYYGVLRLVNGQNYESALDSDITPWLEYFTDGFLTSLHVLDAEIRIIESALPPHADEEELSREDRDILSFVAKFGSINISEAESIMPESSRRSIQRHLKELVDAGYLQMVGETRETKYILANN